MSQVNANVLILTPMKTACRFLAGPREGVPGRQFAGHGFVQTGLAQGCE